MEAMKPASRSSRRMGCCTSGRWVAAGHKRPGSAPPGLRPTSRRRSHAPPGQGRQLNLREGLREPPPLRASAKMVPRSLPPAPQQHHAPHRSTPPTSARSTCAAPRWVRQDWRPRGADIMTYSTWTAATSGSTRKRSLGFRRTSAPPAVKIEGLGEADADKEIGD
jgi:hypothetical protein